MRFLFIFILISPTLSWNLTFWVMGMYKWFPWQKCHQCSCCPENKDQNLPICSKPLAFPISPASSHTALSLCLPVFHTQKMALCSLSQTCHVLFPPQCQYACHSLWVPFRSWILKFHLNANAIRKKKENPSLTLRSVLKVSQFHSTAPFPST